MGSHWQLNDPPTLLWCACSRRQMTWGDRSCCEKRRVHEGAFMTRRWKSFDNIWSGGRKNPNLLCFYGKVHNVLSFFFPYGGNHSTLKSLTGREREKKKKGSWTIISPKIKILWFNQINYCQLLTVPPTPRWNQPDDRVKLFFHHPGAYLHANLQCKKDETKIYIVLEYSHFTSAGKHTVVQLPYSWGGGTLLPAFL